jgi:hypothetical protein
MSRWRNRQTPAVESCSFAGSRPALDTGRWRHTSLRTRRLVQWEFESPPAHQLCSRGGTGRRSSLKTSVKYCRFDSCREYHAPDRTATVAASKTAIRSSIPRGCARWEMPSGRGSSPGSHSIGGREATATLSGPENQRSGKDRMGVRLLRPPPKH